MPNSAKELWKEIPNSGGYFVSTRGHVRRKLRTRGGWRYLSCSVRHDGYARCTFMGKEHTVHRLVAEAFIPNPNSLPYINHKNGVKEDNRMENLEWCTPSWNMQHACEVLGSKSAKKVISITKDFSEITLYASARQAARAVGISPANIRRAASSFTGFDALITGRVKTAKGLYWRTIDKTAEAIPPLHTA